MNLGPGALSQSGSSQGLHSQGSLSDAIGTGLPPSSLMQGQIGNGEYPEHWRQGHRLGLPGAWLSRQSTPCPAELSVGRPSSQRPRLRGRRRAWVRVRRVTCKGDKALQIPCSALTSHPHGFRVGFLNKSKKVISGSRARSLATGNRHRHS